MKISSEMKTDAGERPRVPTITLDDNEHYVESIELSNACRRFYHTRVQATEDFKQKLKNSKNENRTINKSSTKTMDEAMEKLKHEMVCNIEIDFFLNKNTQFF